MGVFTVLVAVIHFAEWRGGETSPPLRSTIQKGVKEMKGKEKTKALLTKLSDGIEEIKSSEEFKAILDCMANFHSYSWRNTLLIHMQYPTATSVAG